MKNLKTLRRADHEKLQEDFQRERQERVVVVERLQKFFPTELGAAELSGLADSPQWSG